MVPPSEQRDISPKSLFSVEIPPEPQNPDPTDRAIAYNRKASLLETKALLEEPKSVRLDIRRRGDLYEVCMDDICQLQIFGDSENQCTTLFENYQNFIEHLSLFSIDLTIPMNAFLWKLKGFAGGSRSGDKRVRAVDFASQFIEAANQFCYDALVVMFKAAEPKAQENQNVDGKLKEVARLGNDLFQNKERWMKDSWLILMKDVQELISETDHSTSLQQAPPAAKWGEVP